MLIIAESTIFYPLFENLNYRYKYKVLIIAHNE